MGATGAIAYYASIRWSRKRKRKAAKIVESYPVNTELRRRYRYHGLVTSFRAAGFQACTAAPLCAPIVMRKSRSLSSIRCKRTKQGHHRKLAVTSASATMYGGTKGSDTPRYSESDAIEDSRANPAIPLTHDKRSILLAGSQLDPDPHQQIKPE